MQPAEPDSNPQCHDPVSAALPDDSVFEDFTHALFTDPAIVQHVQQEDIKQKRQNMLVLPAAVAEAFVHHCASVPRSFGFLLGKNPGIVKKTRSKPNHPLIVALFIPDLAGCDPVADLFEYHAKCHGPRLCAALLQHSLDVVGLLHPHIRGAGTEVAFREQFNHQHDNAHFVTVVLQPSPDALQSHIAKAFRMSDTCMLSDQPPCKEDIDRLEVFIAPRGKAARAMVINTSLPDPTDTVAPMVTRLAEEAVTRNQRASGARKATPMDGRKLDKLYADMVVPQAADTSMDIDDADAEILRDALMDDSTGRLVEWGEP